MSLGDALVQLSLPPRFVAKVDFHIDGCWLWTGSKNDNGYGQCRLGDQRWVAHRLAHERLVGPIPEGLELDHLCRNRDCVNPDHLEPVTRLMNVQRGDNRHTHRTRCPQGHLYAAEDIHRFCRVCRALNSEKRRAKANEDRD